MTSVQEKRLKIILDLEKVNELNEEGCPACGNKFSLGDMAVPACGPWDGGPKLIHENEAVFDSKTSSYFERRWYQGKKKD